MIKLIFLSFLIILPGCTTVDKIKRMWPRDHDPASATSLINLDIKLDAINCKEKTGIEEAKKEADWLNRYAEFRDETQKISTKGILNNLEKASVSNEATCNRWLNLSKTRIKIIQQAWGSR